MNKVNMKVQLLTLPVQIIELFFNEQLIKVHPMLLSDEPTLSMADILFSSSFAVLDEGNKRVQVSIKFQTDSKHKRVIEFSLSCIGIYSWQGNSFNETALKNIYNWGVSVQTGAVRQKLSEILQTSPYHEVWYLPISLPKIEIAN